MKNVNLAYAKKLVAACLLVVVLVVSACYFHFERKSLELRTEAITSQLNIVAKSISLLKTYELEGAVSQGTQFSGVLTILQEKKLLRQPPASVFGSGDYEVVWDNEAISFVVVSDVDLNVCELMAYKKRGVFVHNVSDINDAFNSLENGASIFCFEGSGSLKLAKKT